jgi:hypothetical protein
VEVEANRERMEVLGRRNGRDPRDAEVDGDSDLRVLEMSREESMAKAGGLRTSPPLSADMDGV